MSRPFFVPAYTVRPTSLSQMSRVQHSSILYSLSYLGDFGPGLGFLNVGQHRHCPLQRQCRQIAEINSSKKNRCRCRTNTHCGRGRIHLG
jgi:hypothetical protein